MHSPTRTRRARAKKTWRGRSRGASRSSSATRWKIRSAGRLRRVSLSSVSTKTATATTRSRPACPPTSPRGRSSSSTGGGEVATPVTRPQRGESVTEGTITRWLKAEGDEVEKDEPLAEVDTDKVNAELPSPVAGKIEKFLVSEGTTVDVGTEIVLVAVAGEEESPAAEAQPREDVAAESPTEEFPAADTEAQPAAADGGEKQRSVAEARSSRSEGDGHGTVEDADTLRLQRSSPVVR